MRENCLSGLEGGARFIPRSYPYRAIHIRSPARRRALMRHRLRCAWQKRIGNDQVGWSEAAAIES